MNQNQTMIKMNNNIQRALPVRRILLVFLISTLSIGNAQAGKTTYTNYAKLTVAIGEGESGKGKVYASDSKTGPSDTNYQESHYITKGIDNTVDEEDPNPGSEVTLYAHAKANAGYHFVGWSTTSSEKNGLDTNNPLTVKQTSYIEDSNSPSIPHTTIYAWFENNEYTIHYNINGGSGTINDQEFTYGTPKNLTTVSESGIGKQITVSYNVNGGTSVTTPVNLSQSFTGWSGSDGNTYSDGQEINLTAGHNTTVTMTAQWAPAIVTLPETTKEDMELLGWFDAQTGGNKLGNPGEEISVTATKTIYAQWIRGFNITINVSVSGYKVGDYIMFTVTRAESPAVKYNVSVPLKGESSVTITGVPRGTYTIAPNEWSWNYSASPANYSSQTINEDKTYNFTLTPKNSAKEHDEKSVTNWGS